jgi:hypothetical protein
VLNFLVRCPIFKPTWTKPHEKAPKFLKNEIKIKIKSMEGIDENDNYGNLNLSDFGKLVKSSDLEEDDGEDYKWKTLLTLTMMPKPFGMTWKREKMIEFLKSRGYSIVKRFDLDTDEEFEVAVKSGSEYVPDTRNIVEAFSEEMQNFIIEWSASFNKDKKG